jgi:hypothetical protein
MKDKCGNEQKEEGKGKEKRKQGGGKRHETDSTL